MRCTPYTGANPRGTCRQVRFETRIDKARLLSLAGIFLSIAGFYVGSASSIPALQAVLDPTYVQAKAGIELLQKNGVLTVDQSGFQALASIVEAEARLKNPNVPAPAIAVVALEVTGGGIAFGKSSSRQIVGLNVRFRGQSQASGWDLLDLQSKIEDRWKSSSLFWASVFFWLGIIQTVWPQFFRFRTKKKETAKDSDGVLSQA